MELRFKCNEQILKDYKDSLNKKMYFILDVFILWFDPKMDFILTDLFSPFRNNVQKIKIDFIHFP